MPTYQLPIAGVQGQLEAGMCQSDFMFSCKKCYEDAKSRTLGTVCVTEDYNGNSGEPRR